MVSPTLTHAYCTVDDLREQLGESKPGNLPQNLLVRAINAASRAVDNWTGRRFWQDETPQTLNFDPQPACRDELWIDQDISSTTGLVIATDNYLDGTYSAVWDVADYQLWPYRANTPGSQYGAWWKLESVHGLRFNLTGVRGRRGVLPVKITAQFGWSFVPDPVQEATLLKAAALFKRKDAPFGVLQFGDIAAVRVTRQDIDVVELLSPYVRDVAMVG